MNSNTTRRRWVTAAALMGLAPWVGGCNPGARRPDGPQAEPLSVPQQAHAGESPGLRSRLQGTLVATSGSLVMVNLATGISRVHNLPGGTAAVTTVDTSGRLVRLHRRPVDRDDWQLESIGPGGERQPVWRVSDDLRDPIRQPALSGDGRQLAWVARPAQPPAGSTAEAWARQDWSVGGLMLLSTALPQGSAQPRALGVQVLATALVPHALSWLPDHQHVAVVTPGSRGERGQAVRGEIAWPDAQVELLHTATGERRRLGAGRQVWASVRGTTLLVAARGADPYSSHGPADLRLIDPSTGGEPSTAALTHRPADLRGVIGWLQDRYLVYRATVTPGAPSGLTVGNSPLVGAKLLEAVKVMDVRTGEFLTVLEGVDPRSRLSVA